VVVALAGHARTGGACAESMRACAGFGVVVRAVAGVWLLRVFGYGCLTMGGVWQWGKQML